MSTAFFIGMIALLMLGIGTIAAELGLTYSPIAAAVFEAPDSVGFFDGLFTVFAWTFTAASSFLQLMTFQVEMPAIANLFIVFPIGMVMAWLIFKAIRG